MWQGIWGGSEDFVQRGLNSGHLRWGHPGEVVSTLKAFQSPFGINLRWFGEEREQGTARRFKRPCYLSDSRVLCSPLAVRASKSGAE